MRHAGDAALDRLDPLLVRLRAFASLTERKRGVFYLKSRAFLHFHEDPAGLFADLRAADGVAFDRFAIAALDAQDALIATVGLRVGQA